MSRSFQILLFLLICLYPGLLANCGKSPDLQEFMSIEEKVYSQYDEELLIRFFFKDRQGGIFLDVGSAHPVQQSTTYYLEKHLDWEGIAIDAQFHFLNEYSFLRPKTRFFQYIVSDIAGRNEVLYLGGDLSSVHSDHLSNFGTQQYQHTINVETMTLDLLLETAGSGKIDFLSMDIEGAELEGLSGFTIAKYQPELVCIEIGKNGAGINQYFLENGYERIEEYLPYDDVNWYYRKARE